MRVSHLTPSSAVLVASRGATATPGFAPGARDRGRRRAEVLRLAARRLARGDRSSRALLLAVASRSARSCSSSRSRRSTLRAALPELGRAFDQDRTRSSGSSSQLGAPGWRRGGSRRSRPVRRCSPRVALPRASRSPSPRRSCSRRSCGSTTSRSRRPARRRPAAALARSGSSRSRRGALPGAGSGSGIREHGAGARRASLIVFAVAFARGARADVATAAADGPTTTAARR